MSEEMQNRIEYLNCFFDCDNLPKGLGTQLETMFQVAYYQ